MLRIYCGGTYPTSWSEWVVWTLESIDKIKYLADLIPVCDYLDGYSLLVQKLIGLKKKFKTWPLLLGKSCGVISTRFVWYILLPQGG